MVWPLNVLAQGPFLFPNESVVRKSGKTNNNVMLNIVKHLIVSFENEIPCLPAGRLARTRNDNKTVFEQRPPTSA